MSAAARIPFSAHDEQVIRQLGTWMTVVGIFHLLLGLGFLLGACFSGMAVPALLTHTAFGGVLAGLRALLLALSALVCVVGGALLIQTRMALTGVLISDTEDQTLISRSIHRLKLFFMTELALFALSFGLSVLSTLLGFAAPGAEDVIRSWSGGP